LRTAATIIPMPHGTTTGVGPTPTADAAGSGD
jgi:hypothetical protein